jgi:serine/threonine protein kinase
VNVAGGAGQPARKRLLAGRYRVDGSLGRGGMSEVFHGYDERLDRRVAIKILRQAARDPVPARPDSPEAAELLARDRRRFLREIRTTAQLEHPGTPAVYDTGVETAPDGSPQLWLVMQLLRGTTLEAAVDRADFAESPPTVSWAAAITGQIAAVLADVHRVDIVHRDIKPANVMLVDGGLVKVLDFGIAILRGAGALPRLTQVDQTVGTPVYMSPEQWLGQAVTAASDVYSLGCVLHELLTGDVPFHATADVPLRQHHLQSSPSSARASRPDVPAAVAGLVLSMLAKDPGARPSAEQVYEGLLPLAMASDSARGRSENGGAPDRSEDRDPTRPFRLPLLSPAQRQPAPGSRPTLSEAETRMLLASVRALLDGDRPAEAIRLLEDGVSRVAQDPALGLRLRHELAAALFFAGEYTRAASLFDVAGREYRKYLPPDDPVVLDCSYYAGHAYAELGKPDKALPHLRFYVQNAVATGDGRKPDEDEAEKAVGSRFVVAQMLASSGYADEALAEFRAIRPLLARTFGAGSTQVRSLDKRISKLVSADLG